MPPIYTLTGNLLAERTLEFPDGWKPGRTQRAATESFQVGGKGMNVAKMLHRLGFDVTALAFAGGASGQECRQWLTDHAPFRWRLFESTAPTRVGFVARAPDEPETTWLGPDRAMDAAALQACAVFIDSLPERSILAVCGSFPGWSEASAAPLRAAIVRHAQRAALVVDTYGPPLADLAEFDAKLIKINAEEFARYMGSTRASMDRGKQLDEVRSPHPKTAWVVTDGPRPVWFSSDDGSGQLLPPPVEEVSATGCGDVLLAGLIGAWLGHDLPLRRALTAALPLAAANAASPGIADFPVSPTWLSSGNLQVERTSGNAAGPSPHIP